MSHRKSTKLKLLEGNPGKKTLNTQEPVFQPAADAPPAFLDEEAKAEWQRMAPALLNQGILTEADRAAFAAYCVGWSDFQRASDMLAAHGDIVSNGETVTASPYVKMKRDAEAAMLRFAREFGFTPSSRAGLVVPRGEKPDPFEEWQAKGQRA